MGLVIAILRYGSGRGKKWIDARTENAKEYLSDFVWE